MTDMFAKVRQMQTASASKAEENRKAMPIIGAFVADFKEIFGDDCRVTYAKEGGRELGREDTDVGFPMTRMILSSDVIQTKKGS